MPETERSGIVVEPPCYRCLFEKPISDSQCTPETCEMLFYWLTDDLFEWGKYVLSWTLTIELKTVQDNGSPVEI